MAPQRAPSRDFKERLMPAPKLLSAQDVILRMLDYDPITGIFRWRSTNCVAGTVTRLGYVRIGYRVDNRYSVYSAHRLAWLYIHGEPVPLEIDHIDRDKSNNRINNLRSATRSQNKANEGSRKNNKLGVKGVCLDNHGKYRTTIKVNGKANFLGRFDTLEKAAEAYRTAAISSLAGEFADA